ncbi:MAG: xanthine dehydrogenase family protein molybdopterin-binding subunit [Anaerolineae bacterium]
MALNVVGQRVKRYDGLAHVAGETKFVDDVIVPGMLWTKVFRSPVAKGTIKNIDTSAAEKVAGVAAVITGKDIPNNRYGWGGDQYVLNDTAVRYKGEPIAAVAAVDEDTAAEAVSLIKVDIEEETPVFDVMEAMKPDAPLVRPEGNIFMYGDRPFRAIVLGDVEAGFKEADVIVEGDYLHPWLEHAQLEPQTSLAVPEASGRLTVYTVSQALYLHLQSLCGVLQMPMNKVHYIGGTVGGGFGSKNDMHADHITAVLALKTGRPVKWRWTREEEMLYSTAKGSWHMHFKDGVKKDGRIIARHVRSIHDSGAYVSLNAYVVDKHSFLVAGPYFIPNVYIQGYAVFTNKPPASSMRGFGITPATFAGEVQMDRIAEAVGIDPWEIRFINAFREGEHTATRRVLDSVALIEVMQTLAKTAGVQLPDRLMAMSSAQRR